MKKEFGVTRIIVFMRRKNNITSRYIDTRILQLKEDHDKAKDPHDQKWYNRLIQELEWARQAVSGKFEKDCALEIWK